MAVKDPATLQEPKGDPAKQARRDAVGAEIPVTIHASRTNQGLGKNLPAVHEETKTVIVLQQGAVVRLTASLTTGETVVLTNRMTGADVLCRVGNIKSQSGIQHYVDLEFIQRAPGFWGDAVAASSAPAISQAPPAAVAPPSSVAPVAPVTTAPIAPAPPWAAVPAPAPPQTPIAVAASPQPPTKIVPIPSPTPRPSVRTAPPAPAPAVNLPPAAAVEELQPAPLAEPVAASWMAPKSSSAAPAYSAVDRSNFGSLSSAGEGDNSAVSHKNLLLVAAAALLVLGGAAGGWFYSHQTGAANSRAQQQSASVAAPQPMPAAATPSASVASVPAPLAPAAATAVPQTTPQTDIIIESRPAVDSQAVRGQPQPPPAGLTRASASRRNIPVEPLKVNAPKAKVATARMDAPAMVGNLNDAGLTNALLASAPVAPAPPPALTRIVVGGQLQPPQVLSSRPPLYPVAAKAARIQGVVSLDALVDETGKVVETTVVSGPPQLTAAAQESVRSWKYKPAQLNGKPISVHAKVSVNFSLQ